MRTLYLLRHAKSSWDDPTLADHDRPLALRGIRATSAVAEHLRHAEVVPDVVLCSAAQRTRETLERLGEAIPDDCEVHLEDRLYGAPAKVLLGRLRTLPDDARRVMLIGHNPALQELALRLAASGSPLDRMAHKFPTAALATLEASIDTWSDLAPGCAHLTSFVRPKDLGVAR